MMESKSKCFLVLFSCLLVIVGSQLGICSPIDKSDDNLPVDSEETYATSQPGELSQKKSEVNSKDDEGVEIETDFDSQCSLKDTKEGSFTRAPELFFFSSADHGDQTLGCRQNKVIKLGLNEDGANLEEDPNDWRLDTESIQRLLIDSGSYNKSAPSYIFVHGFLSSWNGDTWMCKLKDKILNETEANVFIVDWSGGAKPMLPIDYGAAVANTKYVGQLLAKFVLTLLQMTDQKDASHFHMIGHSLGAHISGFVGYALGDTPLGIITGLDPAGPCFRSDAKQNNATELSETGELAGNKKRLSRDSANLVMAIHTDSTKFGLNENCGHYDIYVNGGSSQPICVGQGVLDRLNSVLEGRLKDAINIKDIACSHGYSHRLTEAYLPLILETTMRAMQHIGKIADKRAQSQNNHFEYVDKQCYLMARRCSSWRAFEEGECGLGTEGQDISCIVDPLALNPELDPIQQARAAQEASLRVPDKESMGSRLSEVDDEHINGEEGEGASQSSVNLENTKSSSRNWQHFIKTSHSKASICAYTYQLVIAADPSDKNDKLYVDIPLDNEPGLVNVRTGNKALNRLVQVSHKLQPASWTRTQLDRVSGILTDNSTQQDYYTALITFDAAAIDECRDLVSSDKPQTERKRWYLCQAISHLAEARLWSINEETLQRVNWVAMAYLSGPDATIRYDNSYLFEPVLSDVKESDAKDLSTEMGESRRSNLAKKVKKGVKCLFSKALKDGSGCSPGDIQLKYSTPLNLVTGDRKRQALQM